MSNRSLILTPLPWFSEQGGDELFRETGPSLDLNDNLSQLPMYERRWLAAVWQSKPKHRLRDEKIKFSTYLDQGERAQSACKELSNRAQPKENHSFPSFVWCCHSLINQQLKSAVGYRKVATGNARIVCACVWHVIYYSSSSFLFLTASSTTSTSSSFLRKTASQTEARWLGVAFLQREMRLMSGRPWRRPEFGARKQSAWNCLEQEWRRHGTGRRWERQLSGIFRCDPPTFTTFWLALTRNENNKHRSLRLLSIMRYGSCFFDPEGKLLNLGRLALPLLFPFRSNGNGEQMKV